MGSEDLYAYGVKVLNTIQQVYQCELMLDRTLGSSERRGRGRRTIYFSRIKKHGLNVDGSTIVTSASIYLNLDELDTHEKVRKALAHELAHLLPTEGDEHMARWNEWIGIIKKMEKDWKENG